jgi:branched-chain amino acid transport system permease protein
MTHQMRTVVATSTSRIAAVLLGLVAIGLVFAPDFCDRQTLHLLAEIYAYICLATLWNLLAGYAGLVSVGQQAYVGLGGYILFAAALHLGVSPLWAIPVAGAFGALIALPAAALLFRLRGAYFAIGSWVLAEIMRLVAAQVSTLGGGSGTSLPASIVLAVGSTRQVRDNLFYWCALALLVLVISASYSLLRSRLGLALRAVGDNEMAARSNGIRVLGLKLAVYVGVGALTSMTGAMIFLQRLRISPDAAFNVNDWTAIVIFMAVIGGIGRLEGPLLGVLIFFGMRQWLADYGTLYLMLLGALAVVVMITAPRGLYGKILERWPMELAPIRMRVEKS